MQAERMEGKVGARPAADEADHLGLDARIGGGENDLHVRRTIGERQRDRQAVRDLMHLIMVEEETDPHAH